MKTLTRLIYVSRIGPESRQDLDAVVQEVLQVSRRNNRRAGVTGMLLTCGGHFVQALEGEDAAVQATLARVNADPRHQAVRVLGSDFVGSRLFGRWAMCASNLSAADDGVLRVLATRGTFTPYALSSAAALKLLSAIADIQGRPAEAA